MKGASLGNPIYHRPELPLADCSLEKPNDPSGRCGMEWKGRRESENVEDRRMMTPGRVAAGGGIGVLLLAFVVYLMGGDPQKLLQQLQNNPQQQGADQGGGKPDPAQDEASHMAAVVLADTEDVWTEQFKKMGRTYKQP